MLDQLFLFYADRSILNPAREQRLSTVRYFHIPLSRNVGAAATEVAAHAKRYLHAWGFTGIQSVLLDAERRQIHQLDALVWHVPTSSLCRTVIDL